MDKNSCGYCKSFFTIQEGHQCHFLYVPVAHIETPEQQLEVRDMKGVDFIEVEDGKFISYTEWFNAYNKNNPFIVLSGTKDNYKSEKE